MNEYLADGSAIELSKEQLETYRQNNPLYMQERIKILESALDEIATIAQPCCPELYKNCLECDKYNCSFYKIQETLNRIGEH